MRVEHTSGLWAELSEEWTYGDQLAVRRASRGADGELDPEAGSIAIIRRVVKEWSLGAINSESIEGLKADVGNWLYDRCLEAITETEAEDPKA